MLIIIPCFPPFHHKYDKPLLLLPAAPAPPYARSATLFFFFFSPVVPGWIDSREQQSPPDPHPLSPPPPGRPGRLLTFNFRHSFHSLPLDRRPRPSFFPPSFFPRGLLRITEQSPPPLCGPLLRNDRVSFFAAISGSPPLFFSSEAWAIG